MKQMHSFKIDADPVTGEWFEDTVTYIGLVDASEHYAKNDTDEYHHDQVDGEVFKFWDCADVTPTSANVAITVRWVK